LLAERGGARRRAFLIANGRKDVPLTDRYAWGVGGGLLGLGLATFSLTRSRADEGDALLVHSSAALGLGLGALTNFFYLGDLDVTPYTGSGFGAAAGLLVGGTVATFTNVSASRVLLVDLGAGLGAAAGAALGSPLVFENVTPEKTRGFVAATFGAPSSAPPPRGGSRATAPPPRQRPASSRSR